MSTSLGYYYNSVLYIVYCIIISITGETVRNNFLLAFSCLLCVVSIFVLVRPQTAFSIIDPHKKPESCLSCHISIPDDKALAAGNYMLLKDSIDDTCHTCHEYDCCKAFSLSGHNHPSDVDQWDRKKFKEPKTLPLYEGLITCSTCHVHLMTDEPGYKMVRLVSVGLDKVDWSRLCLDCHLGY